MNRPIIAVTPDYDAKTGAYRIDGHYMDAIYAAGGAGVLLGTDMAQSDVEALAGRFDGFLFSGGGDVDPARFGEPLHPACGEISAVRDAFELPLMRAVLRWRRPVLAICRGAQVLNIALGGAIYQDIEAQLGIAQAYHRQQTPMTQACHAVRLRPGGLLMRLTGERTLLVNSSHHQAVSRLAPGVQTEAEGEDGVIEAISIEGRDGALGVQWHPEQLFSQDTAQRALFEYLISCAKKES